MAIELTEGERRAALKVSFESQRRYRGYVTAEDVQQELAIWMMNHDEKVRGWREGTGYRALYKSLKNAAHRYCEREKARSVGYHPSDNVRYGVELVRELLKDALRPSVAHKQQNDGDMGRKVHESKPPVPVEVLDIRRGLTMITDRQAEVLTEAVDCMFDYRTMAERATTENDSPTDEAMRKRVYRALRALAEKLNNPQEEEWPYVHNPYAGIPRNSDANTIRRQWRSR
jgi:hypothetical protein